MAQITASEEVSLEALPDAPDEEWLRSMLNSQNELSRQVVSAFRSQINTDNTTSKFRDVNLTHAQSITIPNPLSVPVQGVWAVRCIGLSTGSDGKTNGAHYRLAMPTIDWQPIGDEGSVSVTPYFPTDGQSTGYVGELLGPITRLRSNGTALTTGSVTNVCTTTSLTLTPGDWQIRASVGFTPAATTTATIFNAAVSLTSATLPGQDLQGVPTLGEYRSRLASTAAIITGAGDWQVDLAPYDYSVTTNTPVYLVGSASFAASTMTAWGSMEARRMKSYMTNKIGRTTLFFFGG